MFSTIIDHLIKCWINVVNYIGGVRIVHIMSLSNKILTHGKNDGGWYHSPLLVRANTKYEQQMSFNVRFNSIDMIFKG